MNSKIENAFEKQNLNVSLELFGGSTELLQKVLDTIPQSVFWKDRDSVYLGCNHLFAELAGLKSSTEIVGLTDFDLPWSKEETEFYRDCDQRVMNSGLAELGIVETQYNSKGEKTWLETNKSPMFDDDGIVIGVLGAFHDISKLKKAEESLVENNDTLEQRVKDRTADLASARDLIRSQLKEKEASLCQLRELQQQLVDTSRAAGMAEMATGVLHDIGNVLNSVKVSTGVIQKHFQNSAFDNLEKISNLIDEHADDFSGFVTQDVRGQKIPPYIARVTSVLRDERKRVDDEFQEIVCNVERVSQIVSAQNEVAKTVCLKQDLDVAELIDESISAAQLVPGDKTVSIATELQDGLPVVNSDRHKILQIVTHLIKNSLDSVIESAAAKPTVKIEALHKNGFVEIHIRDNGVGIPKERLEKIFAHGFTTKPNGHGFGLHCSANMATELGGSLIACSEGLGKGAMFKLKIPLQNSTKPIVGKSSRGNQN